MLQTVLRRPIIATCWSVNNNVTSGLRHMVFRPDQHEGIDENDMTEAREWLANFNSNTIPKNICDISFSRSSGPGGQNVNKLVELLQAYATLSHAKICRVNSKATLRLPVNLLQPLLPGLFHQPLVLSRYYAGKSNSLVIQADGNRKQGDNVLQCFEKLHGIILAIGKSVVRGETSLNQKERVKSLYVLHVSSWDRSR